MSELKKVHTLIRQKNQFTIKEMVNKINGWLQANPMLSAELINIEIEEEFETKTITITPLLKIKNHENTNFENSK